MSSRMLMQDGILVWFDGPDWDVIAEQAFQEASEELLQAAQRDAPWEDRSGDARDGLRVSVENIKGEVVLTLFHTIEYGLWLEVIQNGRFATIMPTLERYASKVMRNAEMKIAKSRRGIEY